MNVRGGSDSVQRFCVGEQGEGEDGEVEGSDMEGSETESERGEEDDTATVSHISTL